MATLLKRMFSSMTILLILLMSISPAVIAVNPFTWTCPFGTDTNTLTCGNYWDVGTTFAFKSPTPGQALVRAVLFPFKLCSINTAPCSVTSPYAFDVGADPCGPFNPTCAGSDSAVETVINGHYQGTGGNGRTGVIFPLTAAYTSVGHAFIDKATNDVVLCELDSLAAFSGVCNQVPAGAGKIYTEVLKPDYNKADLCVAANGQNTISGRKFTSLICQNNAGAITKNEQYQEFATAEETVANAFVKGSVANQYDLAGSFWASDVDPGVPVVPLSGAQVWQVNCDATSAATDCVFPGAWYYTNPLVPEGPFMQESINSIGDETFTPGIWYFGGIAPTFPGPAKEAVIIEDNAAAITAQDKVTFAGTSAAQWTGITVLAGKIIASGYTENGFDSYLVGQLLTPGLLAPLYFGPVGHAGENTRFVGNAADVSNTQALLEGSVDDNGPNAKGEVVKWGLAGFVGSILISQFQVASLDTGCNQALEVGGPLPCTGTGGAFSWVGYVPQSTQAKFVFGKVGGSAQQLTPVFVNTYHNDEGDGITRLVGTVVQSVKIWVNGGNLLPADVVTAYEIDQPVPEFNGLGASLAVVVLSAVAFLLFIRRRR